MLARETGGLSLLDRRSGREKPLAPVSQDWHVAGLSPDQRMLHLTRRKRSGSRRGVQVIDLESGQRWEQWLDADLPHVQHVPLDGGMRFLELDSQGLARVEGERRTLLAINDWDGRATTVIVAAQDGVDRTERWLIGYEFERGAVLVDLATRTLAAFGDPPRGGRDRQDSHRGYPPVRFVEHGTTITCPAGRGLVIDVEIRTRSRKRRYYLGPQAVVTALAVSADERLLAAGCRDGSTWVWERSSGRLLHSSGAGPAAITSLGVDAADGRLLAADADRVLTVWNLTAGQ